MDELIAKINQLQEDVRILTMESKHILNVDEAATMLNVSKQYIYKLCQKNELPYFISKGGKKYFFERKDLESWMLGTRVSSKKELESKAIDYCMRKPIARRYGT